MPNIIEIKDLSVSGLEPYTISSEVQLRRFYEPEPGIFIAESPKVIERALNAGYEPISLLIENKHIGGEAEDIIDRCGNIPVYTANPDILTRLTGYQLTRGALCAMRRAAIPSVESICRDKQRIAILENVVNPTNVGAIFRSAAALGIDAVLLTPACSDPLYRRAARVSMGTVFQIPWTYLDNHSSYISVLKKMGFASAAMALCEDSVSIDDRKLMLEEKLAIVLGTEGDGLNASTISECDYIVCIPMAHGVDSLNVAAASAVAFWQLGKHRQ